MKLALVLSIGLLVLPSVSEAQIELGFDSGIEVDRTLGINVTTFDIPTRWFRIGFPGERISFESLVTFSVTRVLDQTATAIKFLPGIVYHTRRGMYFRGEAGMLLINDPGSSASQFAFGVAAGLKRQIGSGPLYLRLETGVDRWRGNSDFFEHSEFRGLVGISVVVN